MENELFEKAPVHKAYFKFALPVVFSMVISLVYNMVDTYFIAQTNNTNLIAGVSLGAPVFTLMISLGDIFGLGGSSVISRLFGQKRDDDGKRISVFCFYASLILGIIVTAIMLVLRNPILNMLGADADTFTYASQYYTYLVIGAPFIILSFTPSNLLRTEGFATASMIGTVFGSVVNIVSLFFTTIILITTCTFQATGKAGGAFILSISRQGIIFAVVITAAAKIAGYNGVLASQIRL
ncbi:MATE family efflux transporter [uncultured Clostridium sp.]|uniref:MATE family efflux transporter n=1 Tax=uncultured Clostridium sp. TaxID=59620 RepID=UPI0025CC9729|nr:MATE family efflux transporter [uncultured Clostridium sp.]